MPKSDPTRWLGLQVTGDLGGVTYVQNKSGQRKIYVKTYPNKTPTPAQVLRRLDFREAVAAYGALDDEHKAILKHIEHSFDLNCTGRCAYISCYLNNRMTWIIGWAADLGYTW